MFFAALLAAFALPADTLAWGGAGHRVIAQMAQSRLSAHVATEVQRLLAVTGATTLADVATWADNLRDQQGDSALAKATAKMHYINFANADCQYDAARDCPNGQCVVAAIDRFAAMLGDRSRSDAERAEALRFLVHFVGDVHQPLHAGYRSDRGGNNHQVQIDGRGSNLHSVWDHDLLASHQQGWRKVAMALRPSQRDAATGTPRDWAEASCRLTRDAGIYPKQRKIGPRYLDAMREIYAALPADWKLFTEHKMYEPAFYSTVVQDWGTNYMIAKELGDKAFCLVDLGHHAPNVN
ncbi:MAG: S1/P1 nuclease, partial [Dokdonella sp.]